MCALASAMSCEGVGRSTQEDLDIERDCENSWSILMPGLKAIYSGTRLSKSEYLQLYNTVYNYCAVQCCKYEGIESAYEKCCRGLYKHLEDFIGAYVKTFISECQKKESEQPRSAESLIDYYVKIWKQFCSSSEIVGRIFHYIDEHWIKREIEDGNKSLYDIYSLCLKCWRDEFLEWEDSGKKVTSAVVELLQKERQGCAINSDLIPTVQQCYVELGVVSGSTRQLKYYQQTLESAVLNSTTEFYRLESRDFLNKCTVSEYLKKVEDRLTEEQDGVEKKRNLHNSSLEKIIDAAETALITEHIEKLLKELEIYLNNDRIEDMKHMYRVVGRKLKGQIVMAEIFTEHVTNQGKNEIEKSESANDAMKYVEAILKIYDKFHLLVSSAFCGNRIFIKALEKACIEFINNNCVTSHPRSCYKSSQQLAVYCHQLLKKGSKVIEDAQLEDLLDKAMRIYCYLDAKDAFVKYYEEKLAYRLLENLSTSDDTEKSMVNKLQTSGIDVKRIQRMLLDVAASKDLNDDFKKHLSLSEQSPEVNLYVNVLTSNFWPLSQGANIALPQELDMCTQQFRNYYSGVHPDHKLQWIFDRSRGEVTTQCFKKSYIITASTYQIAVLMQYNFADSFTFRQLEERTLIGQNELQQIMRIFLNTKLLVCDDISSDTKEDYKIPHDALFRIFQDYNKKGVRVVINTTLKTDVKVVEEKIDESIAQERNYLVQVMLAKVMKDRKIMQHNDLVSEVVGQLKSKFIPTPQMIKRNIEDLIIRNYLERNVDDSRSYNYVA